MQKLQIINAILSAKPDSDKLNNFNEYLKKFYAITKKKSPYKMK